MFTHPPCGCGQFLRMVSGERKRARLLLCPQEPLSKFWSRWWRTTLIKSHIPTGIPYINKWINLHQKNNFTRSITRKRGFSFNHLILFNSHHGPLHNQSKAKWLKTPWLFSLLMLFVSQFTCNFCKWKSPLLKVNNFPVIIHPHLIFTHFHRDKILFTIIK